VEIMLLQNLIPPPLMEFLSEKDPLNLSLLYAPFRN